VEGSLKRLRLDRIDVYQLHIPDPVVSFDPVVAQNAQWMTWKPACGTDPTDAERNLSNFTGGEIRRVAVMISSESVG